jgi:hypothetical protein
MEDPMNDKDDEEESPGGEIAGAALEEMAGLDPRATILKLLAELTAPAAGVRIEAQVAAKKREYAEEEEEER